MTALTGDQLEALGMAWRDLGSAIRAVADVDFNFAVKYVSGATNSLQAVAKSKTELAGAGVSRVDRTPPNARRSPGSGS